MTKTLPMVNHKNYNLNANEGFAMFFISKLITCFIDGFTLKLKSQSLSYLLNGSEHMYWILDFEGEVHSIWDLWRTYLQECKGNGFFEIRQASISFRSVQKIWISFWETAPAQIYLLQKVCMGRFNVRHYYLTKSHITMH